MGELKNPSRQLISFATSPKELQEIENHIDITRIELRKRDLKFSKKQMYHFLFIEGIKHFNIDNFIETLNNQNNQ